MTKIRVRVNQQLYFPLTSTYFLFPPPDPTLPRLLALGEAEICAESTLALAESGYVDLPGPEFYGFDT